MKSTNGFLLLMCCLLGAFQESTQAQTWNTAGNTAVSADFIGTTNKFNLKFKTRNSLRMTLDTVGRLGIGATAPQSLLHLVSSDSVTLSKNGQMMIGNSTSKNMAFDTDEIQARSNGGNSALYLNKNGGEVQIGDNNGVVWISTAGQIGIGTKVPYGRLHIANGSPTTLAVGGYVILGQFASTNLAVDGSGIQARNNQAASVLNLNKFGGDIYFGLSSANNIVKGTNGYMGLGTLTPETPLHATGGTSLSSTGGGIGMFGTTTSYNIGIDGDDLQARNNGAASTMYLNYYGGDVLIGPSTKALYYRNATGFLGIGKNLPASKVDVYRGRLRFSAQVSANTASGIEFTDTSGVNLRGFIGMADNNHMALWGFGGAGWNFKMNVNDGRVSIGQNINPATGYMLAVDGGIICEEVKVQVSPFPDYVFADNYKLRSLEEVENHIITNKRLPGMPAAAEVEADGMSVGDMSVKLVEKVEELTLYIIQLQKQIDELKSCSRN